MTGWLSSLVYILPSSCEYPDLEKRPIDGPNKLRNYMLEAVQWVIRPDDAATSTGDAKKRRVRVTGVYSGVWGIGESRRGSVSFLLGMSGLQRSIGVWLGRLTFR